MAGPRIIEILLVEDNEDHALLTADALDSAGIPGTTIRVHTVIDGESALAFLHRRPPHANAPRPDLILLDVRIPDRDGFEVLRAIKQDRSLRTIPTIVLTTSDAEVDVARSYELGANEYVTKPVSAAAYARTVRAIPRYWTEVSTLPPKD